MKPNRSSVSTGTEPSSSQRSGVLDHEGHEVPPQLVALVPPQHGPAGDASGLGGAAGQLEVPPELRQVGLEPSTLGRCVP